jgi:hypothetical protein
VAWADYHSWSRQILVVSPVRGRRERGRRAGRGAEREGGPRDNERMREALSFQPHRRQCIRCPTLCPPAMPCPPARCLSACYLVLLVGGYVGGTMRHDGPSRIEGIHCSCLGNINDTAHCMDAPGT